ncbi:gamma-glutamyltranspeptidase/glutathione hydrolase [Rhizomicrobium palustre]|uniref:Gamma-glutamyltranspeptidase/glutathione hydrolase n=1 Tax=Rhizomicrobium palustre TaxID=189966 RepID=A0A846N3Z7_9PROT|nr:gamma-glutamyltransferase [Rhizomicrobium palustre]NIK90456.1 gamma-glutamyltranspeptidase/glutathione hydrolase [Rhizomicrobium palustre]
MKHVFILALAACAGSVGAADFSPAAWPKEIRLRAEAQEASWAPLQSRVVEGKAGMISATVSPLAVEAGLAMLRQGGSAADAAASVALTQVATQLGSVVSYAGIAMVVYYEAKTGKVYALDAGYGTWRGESDPASITPGDISALTGGPAPALGKDLGRQVLVPGFMAGIEAMQKRFGRYGLREALAPATYYAENGIAISPTLAGLFQMRKAYFNRTEAGRGFLAQSGRDVPLPGDIFRQLVLARTLKAVARNGAAEMYSGQWAAEFVKEVRREGGKADAAELAAYRPLWSEAAATDVFGHHVYTNGGTSLARYQFFTALHVAEALKLDQRGPYWEDGETLKALGRIGQVVASAPQLLPADEALLKSKGADTSRAGQETKAYGQILAAALPELFGLSDSGSHHSNAIVVADKNGNIAIVTHTINTVVWGDTGMVVGGIPLPDSAGFQQMRMAMLKPGARLPNEIADFLVLDAKRKPVLAGGSIGTSLHPEVLRLVLSHIGQHQPLAKAAAAPPLLINPDPASYALPLARRPLLVAEGAFAPAVLDPLKKAGATIVEAPAAQVSALRGTVAMVGFLGDTKAAPESAGVMVYCGAE